MVKSLTDPNIIKTYDLIQTSNRLYVMTDKYEKTLEIMLNEK